MWNSDWHTTQQSKDGRARLDLRDKETEGHTQRVADLTYRWLVRWVSVNRNWCRYIAVHCCTTLARWLFLIEFIKRGQPDSGRMGNHAHASRCMPMNCSLLSPTCARHWIFPTAIMNVGMVLVIPVGSREKKFPLAARIFSVVDVWDALLSDRPYRSDWSTTEACHYIRDNSGTHFDPDIVDAFMDFLTVNGLMEECQDFT
jgi:hypothetical protein